MGEILFDDAERVRREVYRVLAGGGRAPSRAEVAVGLKLGFDRVEAAFARLVARGLLTLDDYAQVQVAPPFSTVNRGFSVSGAHALWWGASALDSFAIPHLVEAEPSVLIATTCPGCRAALAWTVTREMPPLGDQVAHFPTSAGLPAEGTADTAGHQRIFCDRTCVDRFLVRSGGHWGEIVGLNTLWHLAALWHDGLFGSPFVPRTPDEESRLYASVGLVGPFWGVPVD